LRLSDNVAAVKELAPGLKILGGFPPYAINVYLVGDVLVDAGSRHAAGRILRQVRSIALSTHVVTHAHADHQGASHAVCEKLELPLWVGELDAEAIEDGRIRARMPSHPINSLIGAVFPGPPHPVARRLHEGDQVADFVVLDTPGHSAGHISLWRESDRTLICGDVITTMDTITGIPGLGEPKTFFTPDPARNRESIKRIAALEPALVCVGHGRPLRDPEKLAKFAAKL
jgi:glyoxylase-like metal-dependent hydrolase (beta-lactamase superfamily II)